MSTLRINLFNTLRVERDGLLVENLPLAAQQLLAYLALYPQTHRVSDASSVLWPVLPPTAASSVLSESLDSLLGRLGPQWFAIGDEIGLVTSRGVWIDVAEFEAAAQSPTQDAAAILNALRLGCPDLLTNWEDNWIIAERERQNAIYHQALVRWLPILEAEHHDTAALECARVLQIHDPCAGYFRHPDQFEALCSYGGRCQRPRFDIFLAQCLTNIDARLCDKPKDVCLETARGLKKMECVALLTRCHGTTFTHFARS